MIREVAFQRYREGTTGIRPCLRRLGHRAVSRPLSIDRTIQTDVVKAGAADCSAPLTLKRLQGRKCALQGKFAVIHDQITRHAILVQFE